MIPDPIHPWGLAIDYAGRGTVTENGHAVGVRLYDNTLGGPLERDPMTGEYPAVYVTAQISETGESGAFLRGYGAVTVTPANGNPAVPDPTAVQRAVEASLTDFETRRLAYAALCAAWAPATPEPDPEPEPEPEPAPEP
ncbi:ATP-binding protein [Streptomyces sp. TX20-6-3]|uniref:ATP-binding protein n=1 Tax=Streptomyces sp. TX20-6-3 TaxID=3028705 RepID=UPI0029BEFABF|nr:ATP-binding protein [Streptomyces sp. TX20-6-3]MDX2559973.1 ATP-binding protein [Streptomyces sp. TX20-6-3]